MIMQQDITGARVQGLIVATGLMTFVCVGLAACLALVAGLFYLAVSFVLLILQATCEVFSSLGATWAGASPLLKVIILGAVCYGCYRLYRARKVRNHAK